MPVATRWRPSRGAGPGRRLVLEWNHLDADLRHATRSVLTMSNTNTVVADFAGTGVWEYNGSGWSNLNANDATLLGIGNNGVIVANLSSMGVWLYNGSSWSQINTVNADVLAIASDTNAIVGDFAGYGVYSYNGSGMSWTQLSAVRAQVLAYGSNGTFVGNFNGYGVYIYNGGWTQIDGVNATALAISCETNTVFGSFPGYGIYE